MDPARRLGLAQIDVVAQLGVSTVLLGGIYALIAVGLTLIFGIMRVVNFAHGEFLMLGMYLAFWSFTLLSMDPWFVLFVSIPLFFGIGFLTYVLVMKGVIHASHNVQIFTTVGLSTALQNMALVLWSGDFHTVRPWHALRPRNASSAVRSRRRYHWRGIQPPPRRSRSMRRWLSDWRPAVSSNMPIQSASATSDWMSRGATPAA